MSIRFGPIYFVSVTFCKWNVNSVKLVEGFRLSRGQLHAVHTPKAMRAWRDVTTAYVRLLSFHSRNTEQGTVLYTLLQAMYCSKGKRRAHLHRSRNSRNANRQRALRCIHSRYGRPTLVSWNNIYCLCCMMRE